MSTKNSNTGLHGAKKAKKDEFYTRLVDIEDELKSYKEQFRNKAVYCNCDDPFESNFFKYFAANFNELGLKKLIATSYKPSPIANTELVLQQSLLPGYEDKVVRQSAEPKGRPKVTANKFIINEVGDIDGNGAFNLDDIAEQLKANKNNEWSPLDGDGDFRSPESIELLKQADIVVTNPPFSLFREYVAQLIEYDKKFLILGNKNSITYKEIFTLIKENKLWAGMMPMGRDILFMVPDEYKKNMLENGKAGSQYRVVDGIVYGRSPSIWFTNLDTVKRHQELDLYKKYTAGVYPQYDNYDAIEVSKVSEIPKDYQGAMGVPITFLDKYNPEQFKIIKFRKGDDEKDLSINGRYPFFRIVIKNRKVKK